MTSKPASNHHLDVSAKGFKHLVPTREALHVVIDQLPQKTVETEDIPLSSALDLVLAEDIFSPVDVPSFNRAAMDGFAVRAQDTYSASASSPILLKSVNEESIAKSAGLTKGETVSIVTGGPMPLGADAVVMIEYVKVSVQGTVEVSTEVHPAENVSCVGEDLRKGTLVLKKGQRLLPQDLGMLTYLGFNRVKVVRKLKVAVLSTGNEICDDPSAGFGKVPDVNRPTLLNAIRELGCEPVDLGIAVDEFDTIRGKLKQAIPNVDVILVTAGTSVGPRDIVPQVINELGKPGLLVHGVAMRPSMPTGLGIIDGKPIVSLPGYPVSAYLAFLEFLPPLVAHLYGTRLLPRPTIKAKLERRVAGILGSRTYVRVQVRERQGSAYVEPVSVSGAGILSSLVRTNGFIIVPENVEGYEEGSTVDVELFRPVEREDVHV